MSAYRFQIYSIIDAFSCRILRVYVGLSNRTQVAVQGYFLDTVRQYGVPSTVRSDKGTKTILIAIAQVSFRRHLEPDIPLRKAFIYRPSTKNQRIENWWGQMIDGQTDQWIQFFDALNQEGYWQGHVTDRVALRYLYMEPLRRHIARFVDVYNSHTIRKQSSRDHYLPAGKPDELYHYTSAKDFAIRPSDPSFPKELFDDFQEQVANFDFNQYQTDETRDLCTKILQDAGLEVENNYLAPGLRQPHVQAYLHLRQELRKHEIEELAPPRGARAWIARQRASREEMIQEMETTRQTPITTGVSLPSDDDMISEQEEDSSGDDELGKQDDDEEDDSVIFDI